MTDHRRALRSSALATIAFLCFAQVGNADDIKRANVVGTWKLLTAETLMPNGEVSYEWMGRNPTGLIIYDATGFMSAQIMRDPRPIFTPDRAATPEEIGAAYKGYYAYFGSYEVDERERAVIHHIQGSLLPKEVGLDYRRRVEISGDRLTLTTPPFSWAGQQLINRLIWERMR